MPNAGRVPCSCGRKATGQMKNKDACNAQAWVRRPERLGPGGTLKREEKAAAPPDVALQDAWHLCQKLQPPMPVKHRSSLLCVPASLVPLSLLDPPAPCLCVARSAL